MSIKSFVVAAAVAAGTFGLSDRADAQWRGIGYNSYPTYSYSYPTYSYSYPSVHLPELLQLVGRRDVRLHAAHQLVGRHHDLDHAVLRQLHDAVQWQLL